MGARTPNQHPPPISLHPQSASTGLAAHLGQESAVHQAAQDREGGVFRLDVDAEVSRAQKVEEAPVAPPEVGTTPVGERQVRVLPCASGLWWLDLQLGGDGDWLG